MNQDDLVERCYALILDEISSDIYSKSEKLLISDEFLFYGRYINEKKRTYFTKTVFPAIKKAIRFLNISEDKCVLDIGCGLGMQSIIFAALGAKVKAIDVSPSAIELAIKRKSFYEKRLGIKLNIEFLNANFKECLEFVTHKSVDAVFSMSAFSYVLPMNRTALVLEKLCKSKSKIFLYEENKRSIYGWLNKFNGIPSYSEINKELKPFGFKMVKVAGVCAIPPEMWKKRFYGLTEFINKIICTFPFLSFSYSMSLKR